MSPYTVLFVDDEPYILKSLQRLFRGDPMRVLTSFSAIEALELMKTESIQLLVTDNMMPEMTGVELARRVKEIRPEIVRIILSGQSDIDAVLKAVNEGEAYRFILKPWNDLDLKVTVNIALAQYKLADDNRQLISAIRSQSEMLATLQREHPAIFDELVKGRRQNVNQSIISSASDRPQEKELTSCPKQ